MAIVAGAGWLAVASNEPAQKSVTGPTLPLESDPKKPAVVPASDLMYFVPLISPTPVACQSSPDNQQISKILSLRREKGKDQFSVIFEYDIKGAGSFTSTYEPNSIIAYHQATTKAGKPMKNVLEYIKLEGDGLGWIEVKGVIVKGIPEVKTVRVHFNGKGNKSPVTVGLYTIEPRNGIYAYANRTDRIVARVNTVTFRNTPSEEKPTMQIEVASVVDANKKEDFWGNLVGAIANLFIPPVEIDKDGNEAMIQFGNALFKGQPSFTFPRAKNLILRDNPTGP